MPKRTPSKTPKQPQPLDPHETLGRKTLEQLIQDPKDAEAYAALMRQLPVHTELSEDDKVLDEVFREREEFLDAMEAPDEEDDETDPKQK